MKPGAMISVVKRMNFSVGLKWQQLSAADGTQDQSQEMGFISSLESSSSMALGKSLSLRPSHWSLEVHFHWGSL